MPHSLSTLWLSVTHRSWRVLSGLCCISCFGIAPAFADLPAPPEIVTVPTSCVPIQEICGDGVDQDCDGSDSLCPTTDKDRDGFAGAADCDDQDRFVYPGISVECNAACGFGTKKCGSGGTFSGCTCSPLCEATGTGKCYYISKATGSDSNAGTFASPWKTYLNVASYYSNRPANGVVLKGGDVVYFMSGVYDEIYHYNPNLPNDKRGLFIRGVNASAATPLIIKAYPGATPTFSNTLQTVPINIANSNYVVLEGLDVADTYVPGDSTGIHIEESSNIDMRNLRVHGIDGTDNNNSVGIKLTQVSSSRIHHSVIYDNYDRTCADSGGQKTENSRNIVIFSGGNIRVDHNSIFNTVTLDNPKGGGCVVYKHGATIANSVFEVDHNVFRNCYQTAVGSGTFNTHVHHNLIIDSDPVMFQDFGGRTLIQNELVEYNTFVNGNAMFLRPTLNYGPMGAVTMRKNVVRDNRRNWMERGIVTISPYGSNTEYQASIGAGLVTIRENCYYTEGHSPVWVLFGDNGAASRSLGNLYSTLASWQAAGFDQSSVFVNPALDSFQRSGAGACSGFGWLSGE